MISIEIKRNRPNPETTSFNQSSDDIQEHGVPSVTIQITLFFPSLTNLLHLRVTSPFLSLLPTKSLSLSSNPRSPCFSTHLALHIFSRNNQSHFFQPKFPEKNTKEIQASVKNESITMAMVASESLSAHLPTAHLQIFTGFRVVRSLVQRAWKDVRL